MIERDVERPVVSDTDNQIGSSKFGTLFKNSSDIQIGIFIQQEQSSDNLIVIDRFALIFSKISGDETFAVVLIADDRDLSQPSFNHFDRQRLVFDLLSGNKSTGQKIAPLGIF